MLKRRQILKKMAFPSDCWSKTVVEARCRTGRKKRQELQRGSCQLVKLCRVLFEKFLPLLFLESGDDFVAVDEDGTLDEHTVGGEQ